MSIAIDTDLTSFQLYQTRVVTMTFGTILDYGDLADGYSTESCVMSVRKAVRGSWYADWLCGCHEVKRKCERGCEVLCAATLELELFLPPGQPLLSFMDVWGRGEGEGLS